MNPGKVVDAYPITSNLRIGPDYNPPQPETHFQLPERQVQLRPRRRCAAWAWAKCRREGGQVMCPSYRPPARRSTRTRGRARLLWEMLNGEVITDGWRSEAVKEALDLCLACKGCKSDCPVNVDMATYKAEFLSHYYEGRLRPRHAYAMGLIDWWARLASYMPRVANFFSQTPGLRSVAKWLGGIAPAAEHAALRAGDLQGLVSPPSACETSGKPPVILWPDTFNNYFPSRSGQGRGRGARRRPDIRCTFRKPSLCCGRPLYDFGMLDTAKRWSVPGPRRAAAADRGRHARRRSGAELPGGLPRRADRDAPHHKDAERLHDQAFLLSEFLEKKAPGLPVPATRIASALVWGHCHHRSVAGMAAEEAVLKKLGLDYQVAADATCCGMAGSFGFERDHYQVAQQIGELGVLPRARRADNETHHHCRRLQLPDANPRGQDRSKGVAFGPSRQDGARQGCDRTAAGLASRSRLPQGPTRRRHSRRLASRSGFDWIGHDCRRQLAVAEGLEMNRCKSEEHDSSDGAAAPALPECRDVGRLPIKPE